MVTRASCFVAMVAAYLSAGCEGATKDTAHLDLAETVSFTPKEKAETSSTGVVRHDSRRTLPGYQLYSDSQSVKLLDLDGNVAHQWVPDGKTLPSIARAQLLPSGDLIALGSGISLVKPDGTVRWTIEGRFHHDANVFDNEIYTLRQRSRFARGPFGVLPILDEEIVRLSMDGKILDAFSLYDQIGDRISPDRWMGIREEFSRSMPGPTWRTMRDELAMDTPYDIFHASTVDVLRSDSHRGRVGDLLLSVRELSTVFVLDRATHAPTWSYGDGKLDHQDHPNFAADGRLVIFDNGAKRGWSRAIALKANSDELDLEYGTAPAARFFSERRGSAQLLGNGNLQVTIADQGHVVEVTPEGSVAWEWYRPLEQGVRLGMNGMDRLEMKGAKALHIKPRATVPEI